MWENFAQSSGGSKRGWAEEGNFKLYIFGKEPTRVRFLMEHISPPDVAKEKKITVEEANEYISSLWQVKWVMPVPLWEHTIPPIPQERLFSVQVCLGQSCMFCDENQKARQNGVSENKLLPYPVRKRFVMPAWFYDYDEILMVKQAQDFWEDIKVYMDKYWPEPMDFDIFKTGMGLNTKYKSVFGGIAKEKIPVDLASFPSPSDIKWKPYGVVDDFPKETEAPKKASPTSVGTGDFVLSFGSHKGMTLKQLYDVGDEQYIKFLAENASGPAKDAAEIFLKEIS